MRKVLLSLLLALGLLGSVHAQQPGSALVVGLVILPNTIDSGDANDSNAIAVTRQIVERLVELAPGDTGLVPGLATSWSANDDSTQWTFHLREGVFFHDGTPFNAQAAKFNLDRWNDQANPYHFGAEGKAYVGWRNLFGGFLGNGSAVSEVTVDDDYTITLELTRSISFLPSLLAAGYFGFDSPAAVMAAGANYGTPAVGSVGTGPYRFELWEEGSRVVLLANSVYRDGPPPTERIVFVGVSDPTARLAQLKAGALDIALGISPTDLGTVRQDPNLEVVSGGGGLNTSYLAMHQNQPPFDDVRVRQAVAYAIDRQAIVDAFYAGQATTAEDILPDSLWGHSGATGYPYDPERARELLTEAGFPDGLATELWYRNSGLEPVIAETIASYLADVGIRVAVKTEDWAAFLADYMAGNFPLYTLGWNADFADPDTFIYTFYGPQAVRRFGWTAPDVVDQTEQARRLPDQAERAAIYASVNDAAHEAMPMLPLAHQSQFFVVRKGVTGMEPTPLGAFPALTGVSKAQ
ncbi:MAG TPA: ABC transporter substrate-binding protein [Trueperaceae bacterium]|nr:ABC transporter substrate-binding protein [Trueperaceae bacterium]